MADFGNSFVDAFLGARNYRLGQERNTMAQQELDMRKAEAERVAQEAANRKLLGQQLVGYAHSQMANGVQSPYALPYGSAASTPEGMALLGKMQEFYAAPALASQKTAIDIQNQDKNIAHVNSFTPDQSTAAAGLGFIQPAQMSTARQLLADQSSGVFQANAQAELAKSLANKQISDQAGFQAGLALSPEAKEKQRSLYGAGLDKSMYATRYVQDPDSGKMLDVTTGIQQDSPFRTSMQRMMDQGDTEIITLPSGQQMSMKRKQAPLAIWDNSPSTGRKRTAVPSDKQRALIAELQAAQKQPQPTVLGTAKNEAADIAKQAFGYTPAGLYFNNVQAPAYNYIRKLFSLEN